MHRAAFVIGLLLVLVLCPWMQAADVKNAATAEWAQWRGPNRDGLSTDKGLLQEWPKDGPKLLWEAKGAGRGYASLAITGGKIYTMGDGPSTADDKDEYLLCFEEATGKQFWKTKLGPAWNSGNADWQSSRSTPTVDGELLYALTAQGSLVCLETATGKEKWRKSLQGQGSLGGRKGDGWGYSESVLIDGDKLVCTPGHEAATMVALDKKTGEVIWKASSKGDRGAAHASIVISQIGDTKVYVNTTVSAAIGVRASDGKVLWTYEIPRTTAVVPTPIVRGDLVFISAGYGTGGALLKQVPTSDGVKVEEVYGVKRELNNRHGGVILVGDYLYGDTDHGGVPFCAELMTGKIKWNKRGSGRGSAAMGYADGCLYIRYADGKMVLAKASPDDYKEISSFKIPYSGDRPSWSHPVIVVGKLYLREGDYILCYDVKQK